jgi:hypothetical protein
LSSVYQSPYQLGAAAAQLALDRVASKTTPVRHLVLPTELKIRESVAPPPHAASHNGTQPGAIAQSKSVSSRKSRTLVS